LDSYLWLPKKFHTYPLNPPEAKPMQFQKDQLTYSLQSLTLFSSYATLGMLLPAHHYVREFGYKPTPSHRTWNEGLLPKFLLA